MGTGDETRHAETELYTSDIHSAGGVFTNNFDERTGFRTESAPRFTKIINFGGVGSKVLGLDFLG